MTDQNTVLGGRDHGLSVAGGWLQAAASADPPESFRILNSSKDHTYLVAAV
jgi:hypothetical protein